MSPTVVVVMLGVAWVLVLVVLIPAFWDWDRGYRRTTPTTSFDHRDSALSVLRQFEENQARRRASTGPMSIESGDEVIFPEADMLGVGLRVARQER